jgi:hypothetical protein
MNGKALGGNEERGREGMTDFQCRLRVLMSVHGARR